MKIGVRIASKPKKNRFVLIISGEITEKTYIGFLDNLNDYILNKYEYDCITVYITSNGGSASIAFAMYDLLRSITDDIYTLAIGDCSSAANVLFSLGKKRFSTENTTFLIHSARIFYNLQQTPNITSYTNKLLVDVNERMLKVLKNVAKPSYFEEKFKHVIEMSQEIIYSVDEMMEFGIVTDKLKNFEDII